MKTRKTSRYEGADISTDIEEAQAYNADAVNDRIRQAVKETRGMVLSAGGELPYAWFHAHSGGLTARAKEGLDYEKDEPGYTQCVKGMENDEAPPEAARWQAAFTTDEVAAAMKDVGAKVDKPSSNEPLFTLSQLLYTILHHFSSTLAMKNLLNHPEARNNCVTKGLQSFFSGAKQKKAADCRFYKKV